MTATVEPGNENGTRPGAPVADDGRVGAAEEELARELAERARAEGLSLTGPGGLLGPAEVGGNSVVGRAAACGSQLRSARRGPPPRTLNCRSSCLPSSVQVSRMVRNGGRLTRAY